MNRPTGVVARVGLDSDALLDHLGPSRLATSIQTRLAETLADIGVLELRGSADAVELFAAIGQLSEGMRTLWQKTLAGLDQGNRIRHGGHLDAMRDVCRAQHLLPELQQTIDLIVLSEGSAEKQGLTNDAGSLQRPGEPELSVADSIDHCDTVKTVRNLRHRGNFPAGTSRDEIWDLIFAPLAEISHEVTLLDRYFLTNASADHAKWLLRALDRTLMPASNLRLLGEWDAKWSRDQAFDVARERAGRLVGSGRIANVEIVLAASWDRGPSARRAMTTTYGPHNRHLRFSCGAAITSTEGFDRLRPKIQGVDGFTWNVVTAPDRLGDLGKSEAAVADQPVRVVLQVP